MSGHCPINCPGRRRLAQVVARGGFGIAQPTTSLLLVLACRAGDNRKQMSPELIKSTNRLQMAQCVPSRTAPEPAVVVVLVKVEPGPNRLDREFRIRLVLVAERPSLDLFDVNHPVGVIAAAAPAGVFVSTCRCRSLSVWASLSEAGPTSITEDGSPPRELWGWPVAATSSPSTVPPTSLRPGRCSHSL